MKVLDWVLGHLADVSGILSLPLVLLGLLELRAKVMGRLRKPVGYTILAVAALAYAWDVADRLGWLTPNPNNLERIYDRTYRNQVVQVGGRDFENVTFEDVIFRYDGGNFVLNNVHFVGTVALETTNGDANNAITLIKTLEANHPGLLAAWKPLPPEHFKTP